MAKSSNYYGTGRRKKSIARVYLVSGNGNITINKRPIDEYFGLETLKVKRDRLSRGSTATADFPVGIIEYILDLQPLSFSKRTGSGVESSKLLIKPWVFW